jgi:hypothetical protein
MLRTWTLTSEAQIHRTTESVSVSTAREKERMKLLTLRKLELERANLRASKSVNEEDRKRLRYEEG